MRRSGLGLLCAALAACHAPGPAPLALPPPADDPLAALTDLAGLLAAGERLCQPLADRAHQRLGLRAALAARERDATNRAAALTVARCCHLLADGEVDPAQLLSLTDTGMAAAAAAGDDPEASYLKALNLGLHVRQGGLEAVGRLEELIAALERAGAAPTLDQGGPLRVLGMLLLQAPPWPAGPGDLEAALELLTRAVTDFPGHPLNHLFYSAALRESGDHAGANAALARAQALLDERLWGEVAARWQREAERLTSR